MRKRGHRVFATFYDRMAGPLEHGSAITRLPDIGEQMCVIWAPDSIGVLRAGGAAGGPGSRPGTHL